MTVTTHVTSRSLDAPDETRTFERGELAVLTVGDYGVGRATFQPGWRWSEHVRPLVGGDSCQVHHTGYVISGQLGVRMNDGSETVARAGEAYDIPPGHDGWVIGDEPCVMIDWNPSGGDYAKPS